MRFIKTAIQTTISITVLFGLAACQTTPDPLSPQEQAKIAAPVPPIVVIPPTEYHTLEKCDKPLGTLRVNELGVSQSPAVNAQGKSVQKAAEDSTSNANTAWLSTLNNDHNLPAPRAFVQWLALQSNCFKVLDLDGSLLSTPVTPASKKPVKSPRVVPADYTVSAKVEFSSQTTEQFQGVVGTFSPAVGAVQSPIKTMDASTQLALSSRRSKAELGVAVGKAANKDFSFSQLMGGAPKVEAPASLLVYESKPEGRLLAGAFVNSFNQMVKTAQDFQSKTNKSIKVRRPAASPTTKPASSAPVTSAPPAYVPIYKRPSM